MNVLEIGGGIPIAYNHSTIEDQQRIVEEHIYLDQGVLNGASDGEWRPIRATLIPIRPGDQIELRVGGSITFEEAMERHTEPAHARRLPKESPDAPNQIQVVQALFNPVWYSSNPLALGSAVLRTMLFTHGYIPGAILPGYNPSDRVEVLGKDMNIYGCDNLQNRNHERLVTQIQGSEPGKFEELLTSIKGDVRATTEDEFWLLKPDEWGTAALQIVVGVNPVAALAYGADRRLIQQIKSLSS